MIKAGAPANLPPQAQHLLDKWNRKLAKATGQNCDLHFAISNYNVKKETWNVELRAINNMRLAITRVEDADNKLHREAGLTTTEGFMGLGLTSMTLALSLLLMPTIVTSSNPAMYLNAIALGTVFVTAPYLPHTIHTTKMYSSKTRPIQATLGEIAATISASPALMSGFERVEIVIPADEPTLAIARKQLRNRIRSTLSMIPYVCEMVLAADDERESIEDLSRIAEQGFFGSEDGGVESLSQILLSPVQVAYLLKKLPRKTELGKLIFSVLAEAYSEARTEAHSDAHAESAEKINLAGAVAMHALQFMQVGNKKETPAFLKRFAQRIVRSNTEYARQMLQRAQEYLAANPASPNVTNVTHVTNVRGLSTQLQNQLEPT